jgi:hypothetical protein
MQVEKRPLQIRDHVRIHPGWVGPVGDVHVLPRFKHSYPDQDIRWDPTYKKKNQLKKLGQNITDGDEKRHVQYTARVVDSNWGGRRDFKTRTGWVYKEFQPNKTVGEQLGGTPQYSWRNIVANTFDAKRTGDKFLPLPGPFALKAGQIPRGGNFMRVTDIVPGDVTVEAAKLQPIVGTTTTTNVVPTVTNVHIMSKRPFPATSKTALVSNRVSKK